MSSGRLDYFDDHVELNEVDGSAGNDHVTLELDDASEGPKFRRLLAESDWEQNKYFSLSLLKNKKMSQVDIQAVKDSGTRDYYERLNTLIGDLEDMASGKCDTEEEVEANSRRVQIGIWASFVWNLVLVVLKVYIAFRSKSMVVIASALDSVLDICSGSVLFVISRLQAMETKESFPIGKERLEPLGIIVFSTIMFSAALQLIIEALKRIVSKDSHIDWDMVTLAMLLLTVISKALLFIYCRYFTSGSASTEALAQDHRNDVISNSAAIVTAWIGAKYWWYADPIGAIGIGLLIMWTWLQTGFEHIRMMTGYRADPNLMKKWTFISLQHDSRILAIENICGYHLSQGFIVEIDIVLPEDMPLNIAHDIGETLQTKLETLPEVERAFVHCDYTADHKPSH